MIEQEVLNHKELQSLARVLRWVLPLLVFLVTFVVELRELFETGQSLREVALFGLAVPALIWCIFTVLLIGLRQRDAARARLQMLCQISSDIACATDESALMRIATDGLARLLGPLPTSLFVRERDNSPWVLTEARRLRTGQEGALAAFLAQKSPLPCEHCPGQPGAFVRNCSLLRAGDAGSEEWLARGLVCLPLADQEHFQALVTTYVDRAPAGLDELRPLLASLGSAFAVALESARLRVRELAALERAERAAREPEALPAVLGSILADVCRVHEAQGSYIFACQESGAAGLLLLSAWPDDEQAHEYAGLARRTLAGDDSVVEMYDDVCPAVGIALTARGTKVGALILAGRTHAVAAQPVVLHVTAQLIAQVVRDSQLTAELEGRAVLDERNRLAGEVHDRVAQGLGYLNFKVQQVDQLLQQSGSEVGRPELQELRSEIRELYTEVRLTIDDLRWPADGTAGLGERIEQYCEHMSQRSGLAISASCEDGVALRPWAEVQLIRILQEALLNVQRHALAQRVLVQLSASDDTLCLSVEDDGRGLGPESAQPGHCGLRIMGERAAALGGQLHVARTPGGGTRLTVTVPLARSSGEHRNG